MIKRILVTLVALVSLAFSFLNCGGGTTVKKQPPVQAYTPRFSHEFKKGEAKADGISLALLRPVWKIDAAANALAAAMAAQQPAAEGPDYKKVFLSSMSTDFEKMLTERGFTLSGPFDSLDDMTFPQKKQADLALTPEIEITVVKPQLQAEARQEGNEWSGYTTVVYYSANGNCAASGFVSFKIVEPLSSQKVWLKKIEVSNVSAPCTVPAGKAEEVNKFLGNGEAKVLEAIYRAAMMKADTYFNSEEMALAKKQSLELREKKVY